MNCILFLPKRLLIPTTRQITVKKKSITMDNIRKLKVQCIDLKVLFEQAVRSVQPSTLVESKVERRNDAILINGKVYKLNNNCYIVGFGKAVLGMASALEGIIEDHVREGIISVPVGIQEMQPDLQDVRPTSSKIKVLEGAKDNLPDEDSVHAARTILDLVSNLKEDSLLFVVISGGGSALLPLPIPEITLDKKLEIIRQLTKAGADINEMNSVRKKLSLVKGGRLAIAAFPCQIVSLILSDVIGDPLDVIASGPTCPNNDDYLAAHDILQKYEIETSGEWGSIVKGEKSGPQHDIPITENNFDHVNNVLIGSNRSALRAAAEAAEFMDYQTIIVSSSVNGMASVTAANYANLALAVCTILEDTTNVEKLLNLKVTLSQFMELEVSSKRLLELKQSFTTFSGICFIFGGETTVEIKGDGVGGRNQELALAFSLCIHGLEDSALKNYNVCLLSAGTDGIDGPTNAAGAVAYSQQIDLAEAQQMNPNDYLKNNDSNTFFKLLEGGSDLIVTGHTGTNVMDIQILTIKKK